MKACLLDVLDLFAKLFQLGLQEHDFASDGAVGRFGADGVDLAIHFLGEEIQRAANGVAGF